MTAEERLIRALRDAVSAYEEVVTGKAKKPHPGPATIPRKRTHNYQPKHDVTADDVANVRRMCAKRGIPI